MTVEISYINKTNIKGVENLIFFVNESLDLSSIKEKLSSLEFSLISELKKVSVPTKEILIFDVSSRKKIVLITLKKNFNILEVEKLGAKFFDLFKEFKKINFILDSNNTLDKSNTLAGYFLHGLKLKSYEFDKYKTKKKNKYNFHNSNW